jgi:hypothetical protein
MTTCSGLVIACVAIAQTVYPLGNEFTTTRVLLGFLDPNQAVGDTRLDLFEVLARLRLGRLVRGDSLSLSVGVLVGDVQLGFVRVPRL